MPFTVGGTHSSRNAAETRPEVADRRAAWFPQAAGAAVAALGAAVFAGWLFDIPSLRGPLPGLVQMKANTALAFMCAGASLYLSGGAETKRRRTAQVALAAVAVAVGLGTLLEYLLGRNIGIDELLFRDSAAVHTVNPGRLAPQSAVDFVLLGLALMLGRSRRPIVRSYVQCASLAAFCIALFALIGYAYGVEGFNTVPAFTPIALHSAVGFAVLALGVACVDRNGIAATMLRSTSAGSMMTRRLLPVIFVVLPLIGWGRLVAERNGVLGTETGVALMVVAGLASFTVGVAITARKLNEADRVLRRRSADTASRLSTLVESSHDAILTVRPDGVIAGWNAAAEAMFGYVADEAIGAHITLITPSELREETESVLVSALNAQAVTDRETVRTTKDGRALDVSITVWPLHDGNGETIGVSAIICDITARKEAEAELRRTMARLGQAKADLEASRAETIRRLTRAVEHRDDETGAHVERMSRYCGLIARELGLSPALCDVIATASPMHDVGKIAVPDAILYKPGPLTDDERATMQLHAEEGYRILAGSGAELLEMAATIALSHHERVDGTGYPRGLRGDAIPLAGRIAAVADVFDALTSDRPYRAALSLDETLAIMRDGRGTHFDPEIFDAFLRVLARPDQGDAAHDELALWRAYPPEQARI